METSNLESTADNNFYSPTLKIKAACSSKMLVNCHTTIQQHGLDGQGTEYLWGWDFSVWSRPNPRPTQPPGSFPWVGWLQHSIDHLLPSTAVLQMGWSYMSTSPCACTGMSWGVLIFTVFHHATVITVPAMRTSNLTTVNIMSWIDAKDSWQVMGVHTFQ